jgi:hypothetical protein
MLTLIFYFLYWMWAEALCLTLILVQLIFYICVFGMMAMFWSDLRSVHFHHWTIGMIIASFMCYNHWLPCIVHAIFNGVAIEGGARYGYDRVFKPIDDYKADDYPTKPVYTSVAKTVPVGPLIWWSYAD